MSFKASLKWALVALGGGILAIILLTLLFPKPAAEIGIALERTRAGLELRTLQAAGVEISYLEGGQGEPLLLVHGFGADKDNWTRVAGRLTSHYRVIAVDLPGFGDSGKPIDRRYRIQDQVENLHAIIQAFGLKTLHLGGSSMGGQIVASYAARYPQAVRSLWLLAPLGVATAKPSEMFQEIERMGPGARMPLISRTPEDFRAVFDLMFVKPPMELSAAMPYLADRAVANHKLHERIYQELRDESIPLENLMGGSPVPARIVWGEQDRVLDPSGAKILATLMPKSSVFLVPDAGHLPMIERPRLVAKDYLKFRASLQ